MSGHPFPNRTVRPDLGALLADPARVAEIPAEAISTLLGDLERLKAALWMRVAGVSANGYDRREASAEDRLLTIPEVAVLLGVPKGYVYDLARRQDLPTVRFGKYVRVPVSALRDWVGRHRGNGLDIPVRKADRTRRRGR